MPGHSFQTAETPQTSPEASFGDNSTSSPYISILVPVFNERESLPELYKNILRVVEKHNYDYEILFIDDGSTDGSFQVISDFHRENAKAKGIKLRKNFGKSTALNESFRYARGNIFITMDADLQDDPEEIPRFLDKLDDGYDLVSGWKQTRRDSFFRKTLPSRFFNFFVSLITGLKLHDFNNGFKAYKCSLGKNLNLYGDLHRYIPALAFARGYKVAEIPVRHHARQFGKSKFGPERFFHGLFDFMTVIFLTRFFVRPMHFFGWFGGGFFLSGFAICSYLTLLWFGGEMIGHRPLLILGVLLILVGVQMISTGLIAEMITHTRQDRSDDVTESVLGLSRSPSDSF